MRTVLSTTAIALVTTIGLSTPLLARDRDRGDVFVVTPNQVVDMADARIAQLKADLRLTADQDKNWGGLQSALHDMAQRRADRMTKMREQRSAQSDANAPATTTTTTPAPGTAADNNPPRDTRNDSARNDPRTPDAIASMRVQADALAAKSDDLKKFADASGPLYNSLDDTQRSRFMAFVDKNLMSDEGQKGYGDAARPERGGYRDHYRGEGYYRRW